MNLTRLRITDFRNIRQAACVPGPDFNLVLGDNGSGKTSLLEVIYTLGMGKSFRVAQNRPLIGVGADRLALYAELSPGSIAIGMEKSLSGSNHIVLNGDRIHSASQLATVLPVQQISLYDFQLFEGGPRVRRRFLDWGVFHVEQGAAGDLFRRFDRAIKQRNTVLKSGKMSASERQAWDQEYFKASLALDRLRKHYIEALMAAYSTLCEESLDLSFGQALKIEYSPGWDQKQSLEEAVNRPGNRERERRTGTTQLGPHRADLNMTWQGLPARDMLSRGQMKVLGHALKLAQIRCLVSEGSQQLPVILLDDLAAELDRKHLTELLALVRTFKTQVFLTALDQHQLPPVSEWLKDADIQAFHIQDGQLANISLQE